MLDLNHYLMGLGNICDTECSMYFHKCKVTIYDPHGLPLLQGWQENKGAKLWQFSLRPQMCTPSSRVRWTGIHCHNQINIQVLQPAGLQCL